MTRPLALRLAEIPWEEPAPDGTRSATLTGQRVPGVQFAYAFSMPGGFWDPPHSHAADAHVFVMSGELRLVWGAAAAPSLTDAYPAGSYLFVPAGVIHADGADVDTVILGCAVGPWSTDYA